LHCDFGTDVQCLSFLWHHPDDDSVCAQGPSDVDLTVKYSEVNDIFVHYCWYMDFVVWWQTSNLLNPPRNRENAASMIDRKAAVKPAAGRPRAALGNISNKAAPPVKAESTKVVIVHP